MQFLPPSLAGQWTVLPAASVTFERISGVHLPGFLAIEVLLDDGGKAIYVFPHIGISTAKGKSLPRIYYNKSRQFGNPFLNVTQ